jgi:hypothetical protein
MLRLMGNSETPLPVTIEEEYRSKVVDMVRAFKSLQALFTHVRYEVRVGTTDDGEYKDFKHVEGTVFLDWGSGVPGSFKLRTFLEGEATMGIVDATKRAMTRVFSYCFERAEVPHTDRMRRLMAMLVEAKALLNNFRHGNHIEITMTPNISVNPFMDVMLIGWIDDQQFLGHVDSASPFDDGISHLHTEFVDFMINSVGGALDSENEKRLPPLPA